MEILETLLKAFSDEKKVGRTPESESPMAFDLIFLYFADTRETSDMLTRKLIAPSNCQITPLTRFQNLKSSSEAFRIPMGKYFHLNFLPSAEESPVSPLAISRIPMIESLWYMSLTRSVKDMYVENTLVKNGANEGPEQTVTSNHREVLIELETSPTDTTPTKSSRYRKGNFNSLILLIAAILAFLTFKAGLNPYSGAVLLWLNSAVFVASEAVIVFLARELPLQTWLLVSVFSLFGTYICSIITTFPHTALTVLYAGSPLLVFLAVSRNCVPVLHQPSFSAHNELSA